MDETKSLLMMKSKRPIRLTHRVDDDDDDD
jgi:hypothetical protein